MKGTHELIQQGIIGISNAKNGPNPWAMNLTDSMPWQLVELKDKTPEWKQWFADYLEFIGDKQVEKKKKRIIKNRMLASGILDLGDYIINGEENHNYLNNLFLNEQELVDPIKKFQPLIPPFVNVLKGEFIKRQRRPFITCIDRGTEDEKLKYKKDILTKILIERSLKKKEEALRQIGISNVSEEELSSASQEEKVKLQEMQSKFQEEMTLEENLIETQMKFKKYRHIAEEFAQLIFNKDYERFNMAVLEKDAFIEKICNEEVSFVIDMQENDYKPIFIDNSKSFHHLSDDLEYYSEGDYFGWFEDVTIGDIINQEGKDLTEDQFETLQKSLSSIVGDGFNSYLTLQHFKNFPGYNKDWRKPITTNVDSARMTWNENEIINNLFSTNSTSPLDERIKNLDKKQDFLEPKLFKKMTSFFKCGRKIGWLVKKNTQGQVEFTGWVDENFKLTIEPIYDLSLTKEKSQENLVYGEHIEWTWVNEWRKIKKISPNLGNSYWFDKKDEQKYSIYIGGDPVETPFKGNKNNPFHVDPPFEGREFKMKGLRPVSYVDSLSGPQILYNIVLNRVPDIIADDLGIVLWMNALTLQNTNSPGVEGPLQDPLTASLKSLYETKTLVTKVDREIVREMGNAAPVVPQVLNLSRINEAQGYLQMAVQIRELAGEIVGVSRQRRAQSKASESATQTQLGIDYSETQTEHLFNDFIVDFMPRFYQKMVEAGMYYASKSEEARAFYQTSEEGNIYLELENNENSLRHYSIVVKNDAFIKGLMSKIERLFFNNNTLEADPEVYIEGVAGDSPSSLINSIREMRRRREEEMNAEHKREMEKIQAQEKMAKEQQELLHKQKMELQDSINQSNQQEALIRALGGIQTDNNSDGQIDAMQNLQNKISQIQGQLNLNLQKLEFDKTKHEDQMNQKDKELLAKQSIEQKKLAVAIANSQKSDDKQLNKKIANKQGVI